MLGTRAGTGKTVTAVMGEDGKVYFQFAPRSSRAWPRIRARLPDWVFTSLSFLAAAVVAAIALSI